MGDAGRARLRAEEKFPKVLHVSCSLLFTNILGKEELE